MQAQDRVAQLAGILASVTANFSMGAPKKALRPEDFVRLRSHRRAPVKQQPVTGADVFAQCNTWRIIAGASPLPLVNPEALNAE